MLTSGVAAVRNAMWRDIAPEVGGCCAGLAVVVSIQRRCGREPVGVGVQRCQPRDVVVFRVACAAPGRRSLDPAASSRRRRGPLVVKQRGEPVFTLGDAGPDQYRSDQALVVAPVGPG